MSKLNLSKLEKLQQAASEAAGTKADLSPTMEKTEEKRTVKMGAYVKPSEKEEFLSLIGRQSESDALRDLVLKFIESNKK